MPPLVTTAFLVTLTSRPEGGGRLRRIPTLQQARRSVERGLAFVEKDAVKWREERKCSTCHHGAMTVWVLSEARSQGYPVRAETLADQAKWARERLKDIDKPRDARPGWNMVSTPAVYLAMTALTVPGQDAVPADELGRIAGHLVRHQEPDGSWAWSIAAASNRPPPVFESDEVVTLMAYLAVSGLDVASGPDEKSAARRAGRRRRPGWGRAGTGRVRRPRDSACSGRCGRAGRRRKIEAETGRLLGKQNGDGGWGQDDALPSDAFATGQATLLPEPGGGGEGEGGGPTRCVFPCRQPEGGRLLADDLAGASGGEGVHQPGPHHLLRKLLGDPRPDALAPEVRGHRRTCLSSAAASSPTGCGFQAGKGALRFAAVHGSRSADSGVPSRTGPNLDPGSRPRRAPIEGPGRLSTPPSCPRRSAASRPPRTAAGSRGRVRARAAGRRGTDRPCAG